MAAFRARGPSRRLAYDQVEEVATAALYLHDLLVMREDDIEYDPFTRDGVSRDPVIEAVPTDSILRNDMNARIDRLTEALDRLNALAAVRTRRLQDILFSRLWAAMLAAPPALDSLHDAR